MSTQVGITPQRGAMPRPSVSTMATVTTSMMASPVEYAPSSKRGNRYLRVLFVQAAWVVLIRPQSWERKGLKPWIETAKRRLHHNVLAIALANKLARIAWAVLNKGRNFECAKTNAMMPRSA